MKADGSGVRIIGQKIARRNSVITGMAIIGILKMEGLKEGAWEE